MSKLEVYENNFNYSYDIDEIFARQEQVFYEFLGIYPNSKIRILSPFRPDNKPGCRFNYYNSIWYLIDNAGYKGKLAFNCIEVVMQLHQVSFKEALRLIYFTLGKIDKDSKSEVEINTNIEIYFEAKQWQEDNYFTRNYDLPVDYLKLQPYYSVKNYQVNTKSDRSLKLNRFYNPDVFDVIAYSFDNRTKLYFPERQFRFYSNCQNDDIYGWHRMEDYLTKREDRTLFITKSAKDEMVLNYHFDVCSVGLQSEIFKELPIKLLEIIKYFDTIIVHMDNDKTGLEAATKVKKNIIKYYPEKNVQKLITKEKDISDELFKIKKH